MANSVALDVNHVAMGDDMEWSLSTEEILGGAAKATLIVQDRTLSWEPEAHWDVKASLIGGPHAGHVIFRGEIINEPLELELGLDYRRWKLECADYTGEFGQRNIGALDGKTWLDTSGLGVYVNIDPHAASLKTDRLTVQQWFDHYIRVDGTAIGTDTHVHEYLSDFLTLNPTYSNLQRALEEMAAYVAGNLQFWLDPDLEFHWTIIPSWQEVIGAGIAGVDNLALMLPATPTSVVDDLGFAPYDVIGPGVTPGANSIGFHKLNVKYDGSEMPEQVYVRGGTGYVYNAPPIPPDDETKTVVKVPVQGAEGTYQLRITQANTKLWHTDGTGYVSITYELAGVGGPWPVKYVRVAWNDDRNKGGYYWKFLSGPHQGLLADDHTNGLTGYGGIRVTFIESSPGDPGNPQIGIGGSGWVNEVTQDRTKRQAYLGAPISVTKAMRDSLGGQALYRGSAPTLRGSVELTGYDGWRVGTLLKATDPRLPTELNGQYFVIQRVATTLHKATQLRKYNIDFGDGPTSRYSYKASRRGDVEWPHPANALFIEAHDLSPGPNTVQIITGQLVNGAGEPWNIAGKVVQWSLQCYNEAGVLQAGQGTLEPTVSVTNEHGKAHTKFTSGSGTALVYFVFGAVKAV